MAFNTKVYVIGVGMGNPDTLTVGAREAISSCDLLIGAQRLVDSVGYQGEMRALFKPDEIREALIETQARTACVLFSGDVGFFSGASALYEKIDEFEVEVIPGISSLVYFCAKLHTTWQDAHIVSVHGREGNVVGAVQTHAKTFALTGGNERAHDVCAKLVGAGLGDVIVHAGSRLSYDDEEIIHGSACELAEIDFVDLTVLLIENPHPITRKHQAPCLADDAFIRTKAPMTKEEIRELAIAKMQIELEHVIWDVGAGTGSVSVEAAFAACAGSVYAIEKNSDALDALEKNKDRFHLSNLHIVGGEAPEVLAGLPKPDCVFVGGSSGQLEHIVAAAVAANPHVRLVATGITLETVSEMLACLKTFEMNNVDLVNVSVAQSREIGNYHMMTAQNPIYLLSADAGADAQCEANEVQQHAV